MKTTSSFRCRLAMLIVISVLFFSGQIALAQNADGVEPTGKRSTEDSDTLSNRQRSNLTREAGELVAQAEKLSQQGKYADAARVWRRILAILRKLFPVEKYPSGHLNLSNCLSNLSAALYSQGEYARAGEYYQQALAMQRKLFPTEKYPNGHPHLASSLSNLGTVLESQGEYVHAAKYLEQALAMNKKLFPAEEYPNGHAGLAASLNNLGTVLNSQGDYARAADYFQQSLLMQRKLFPTEKYPSGHPALTTALDNLGSVYGSQGDYARSMDYHQQALAMCLKLFPVEKYPNGHPLLATSLNNVGLAFTLQGDYARAAEYHWQALKMIKKFYPIEKYPNGHPNLATFLNNLGGVLQSQGEYARAADYYQQALAMDQRLHPIEKFPIGNPFQALSLSNLGTVLRSQGEYARGAKYLEQALVMRRKLFPVEEYPNGHHDLAISLHSLGAVLESQGKYSAAADYYLQALDMVKKLFPTGKFPNGHPDLAASLSSLGTVLQSQGEYVRAAKYFQQSLAIQRKLFPTEKYPSGHPDLATRLNILGGVFAFQGEYDQAMDLLLKGERMKTGLARTFFASASEAETLNYAAKHLALHWLLSTARDAESPVDKVYEVLWNRRGIIEQILSSRQEAILSIEDASTQEIYDTYLTTRRDLSRLMMAPAEADPKRAERRYGRLAKLSEAKETLERQLASAVPEFRRQLELQQQPHTDLVEGLSSGSVMIDILHYYYRQQVPKFPGRKGWRATPSYVAFLLQHGKPVVRIELGSAKPIDDAVNAWRESILKRQPSQAASELRRLVWQPIEAKLSADTKRVYLCPDGSLTRMPWVALPGRKAGSVLLEDYTLAYVPHGKFLLSWILNDRTSSGNQNLFLAVGDVHYDDRPQVAAQELIAQRGLTRDAVIGDTRPRWKSLAGTKDEIATASHLATQHEVRQLTGTSASTTNVLTALPVARWAHFATHGFFADAKYRSIMQLDQRAFEQGQLGFGREQTTVAGRNPLVLSGLVFAGANLPRSKNERGISEGDGGILTAEAIAGLPLGNLELAVLSACETGLGEVAGGEGIFGLQRAFHMAGTKNVVASLWKVDDRATAALMKLFYYKLWQENKSPIVALRESQLALYRHPDQIGKLASERGPDFSKTVKLVDGGRKTPAAASSPESIKLWAAFTISGVDTQQAPGIRTWTDSTSRFRVEARLIQVADGKVQLKKSDGVTIEVPVERLSKKDQQYLQELGTNTPD